jgi:NAD(P)-dependent dehydrogenase (short-subunit alcohol dehydrogenase family)
MIGITDVKLDKLKKRHLFGKIAKPEEIAKIILFLANAKSSSSMTGDTIVADGAVLARLSTDICI